MIYTIGHTESYERYFREQGTPQKLGRSPTDRYSGGSVWETRAEAQAYCPEGYQVYGVDATWGRDTIPSGDPEKPGMHYLAVTSDLVELTHGD